jgi:uncharacterized membrane protein (DUF485 family)
MYKSKFLIIKNHIVEKQEQLIWTSTRQILRIYIAYMSLNCYIIEIFGVGQVGGEVVIIIQVSYSRNLSAIEAPRL